MDVKKLVRNFLGKTTAMPRLSASENLFLSSYVRREFHPKDWTDATVRILEMVAKIECELPFHFVTHGVETKYQIFVPRDSDKFGREGYKIGRFLEKLFEERGYSVYAIAEQKPVDSPETIKYGTGWGWNVFVSFPG